MNLSLFLAAYVAVFVAELVGDKLLYTISSLATRFRPFPMLSGITIAFMAKMLAAVLLGRALAELPALLVAGVSATTFFAMALVIWFKEPEGKPQEVGQPKHWSHAALISFSAIFFSEWGDVGQITAAALAARYQAPLVVWLGATLAMVTKGTLAMTLGVSLRIWIPRRVLRYGASLVCVAMGILSLFRID